MAEQADGTALAVGSPHEAGIWPERRATAVRKEAKLHVNWTADKGVPLLRENCSARLPLDGVYVSIMPI